MTAAKLATEVQSIMSQVLVHQRQRWATAVAHQRGYEAWWKVEFATALESWCWRADDSGFGVLPEARFSDFGLRTDQAADILVAPWNSKEGSIRRDEYPRVWVELKERGTWWGGPAKAFGPANKGLLSDFEKLETQAWSDDEVAIACQIVTHDGTIDERLPRSWLDALNGFEMKHRRMAHHAAVGFPLGRDAEGVPRVRWTSLYFFQVRGIL
ncbi:hypothetical protein [Anaeromyxobacter paludicola]|uniref:hypothetical protein n=1 Tax=Anaeromyxobacter paludicola TaxID=2918171 RepID=UPI0020BF9788|nr:hypothetical protein [Anaeromyxobacter paludicola]